MDVQQLLYTEQGGWQAIVQGAPADVIERPQDAQLVMYFAAPEMLERHAIYKELAHRYPYAHVIGASTSAQLSAHQQYTGAVSAVAIRFKDTQLRLVRADIAEAKQSYDTGKFMGRQLAADDLNSVLLVADSLVPDAAALAATLSQEVGPKVHVWGLTSSAGLGVLHTQAGADENPGQGKMAAIGFYGKALSIRSASVHGCAPYGAEHMVTKAEGRELQELDGRPALETYRKYLKGDAYNDEEQRLRFPLFVRQKEHQNYGVLRTVVAVNEGKQSLTLGGSVQAGRVLQLMYAAPGEVALAKENKELNATTLQLARTKGDRLAVLISTSARNAAFGVDNAEEAQLFFSVLLPETVLAGGSGGGVFIPEEKSQYSRFDEFSALLVTLQE
jgi:hypothetical protein